LIHERKSSTQEAAPLATYVTPGCIAASATCRSREDVGGWVDIRILGVYGCSPLRITSFISQQNSLRFFLLSFYLSLKFVILFLSNVCCFSETNEYRGLQHRPKVVVARQKASKTSICYQFVNCRKLGRLRLLVSRRAHEAREILRVWVTLPLTALQRGKWQSR